jgi:hypothetical protein
MVRPYGHRTSSPPSRRLLARRPLDLGLGLHVQTLAADHRDTNSTATVPSLLYCCHRIGVVSYDFSDNTHTQVCSAGILNFRHPSVEKIPPWAAPTPLPLALPVPRWTHSWRVDSNHTTAPNQVESELKATTGAVRTMPGSHTHDLTPQLRHFKICLLACSNTSLCHT